MRQLRHEVGLGSGLRLLAGAAFAFYLGWNLFFLGRGQVPPSIWSYWTGLPCPSSGGTRSLFAFLAGDWREGLLWNPFSLVFLGLMVWTAVVLLRRFWQRRELQISAGLGRIWLGTLALAWVAKFALGRGHW